MITESIPNRSRQRLLRSRWAAIGAAIAVTFGGGGLFVANAGSSAPSAVVTIDPVRILDTRDPANVGLAGPLVSAISQKLRVTGSVPTTTGIQTPVPLGATGVLLNVTVVRPLTDGFLSVRPGDATGVPSTSSLNFEAGVNVPNSVQVGLPTAGANAGQIDIVVGGQAEPTTDVLIDVVGYMVAGAAVTGPVGPAGPIGATGPRGISAFDPLPALQTVTGEVLWQFNTAAVNQVNLFSVDFPAQGTADLTTSRVEFGDHPASGDTSPLCTGSFATPTAPSGYVCIYIGTAANASDAGAGANGSQKRSGFRIDWTSPGVGQTVLNASWAYTPPAVLVAP